jgi:hypothetical protein
VPRIRHSVRSIGMCIVNASYTEIPETGHASHIRLGFAKTDISTPWPAVGLARSDARRFECSVRFVRI